VKIKCFFFGHQYPKTRADRSNPNLSLALLLDPWTTLSCERCGHKVEAKWEIVVEQGIDYLEAMPVR
jgi:hypothetical protein